MNLDGKIALVTGASRGIGKAIALELAKHGATVACVASSVANAGAVVSEIMSTGGEAAAFGCDLGQIDQIEALVASIEEQLGAPSIVVNNAGLTRDTLLMRMKDEDWQRVIDVNLTAAYKICKETSRGMMKARFGRIINISSVIGLHGGAGQANYAASKAGLIGLTLSLAKEFGSRGITCNAIAPGFIETDMTESLSEEMRSSVVKNCPIGRLGTAQDIAPVIAFLASENASYITGQIITIDGGLYL